MQNVWTLSEPGPHHTGTYIFILNLMGGWKPLEGFQWRGGEGSRMALVTFWELWRADSWTKAAEEKEARGKQGTETGFGSLHSQLHREEGGHRWKKSSWM